MSTITKLNYLADTKDELKDKLNEHGANITNNDTFRSYVSKINDIYDGWPKVTSENTEITLTPTKKAKMNIGLKGNTSQASTTGINLLNLANYINYSHNGVALTINPDKSFKVNGTVSAGFSYNKSIPNGLVLNGSYTFVLKRIKGTSKNTITFTLGTGSAITGTNVQNLKDSGVNLANFTLENVTATEVRCYFNKNNSFNNDEFQLYLLQGTYTEENLPDYEIFTNGASPNPDYPQQIHVVTGNNTIRIGNTDYPVNLGSLEFCEIGTYRDYLYKENGNWYKYNAISKTTLNGSETYTSANTSANVNTTRYYARTSINRVASVGLFNKFINRDASMSHGDYEYNWFNGTDFYINILKSRLSEVSTDGIKQYVTSNNLTGYGALSTPTSTQITDETLISQLDAIYNAMSSNGSTTISQTNADLPFIINASALKKGGN